MQIRLLVKPMVISSASIVFSRRPSLLSQLISFEPTTEILLSLPIRW